MATCMAPRPHVWFVPRGHLCAYLAVPPGVADSSTSTPPARPFPEHCAAPFLWAGPDKANRPSSTALHYDPFEEGDLACGGPAGADEQM